jgi:E3 ubiquitin-protein ligase UBR7
VFSCLTCTPSGDAGFCIACSFACHDGHDVWLIHTSFCENVFVLVAVGLYEVKHVTVGRKSWRWCLCEMVFYVQVVELWTRRHFRCDCGNSKYGQGICKLQADKDIENAENVYNQNYKGVYCTCHRVYPDPEGGALGEMLQCCICEDWFHELHLGLPPALQVHSMPYGFGFYFCYICILTATTLQNGMYGSRNQSWN